MCWWCVCACYKCCKFITIDYELVVGVEDVISIGAFALLENVANVGVEDALLSASTKDVGPNGGFALSTSVDWWWYYNSNVGIKDPCEFAVDVGVGICTITNKKKSITHQNHTPIRQKNMKNETGSCRYIS
jgi:hypothetical protein